MSFPTKRLNNVQLDWLFEILLERLEENGGSDDERKIVNCILPVQKYKLLQRFLSIEEDLSDYICMRCLHIFLDENTKVISFGRNILNQETVKSILGIIPKYCPNIETVDLRRLTMGIEIKNNFETFLKQSTQLKSLRVNCEYTNCAIGGLLLKEEFNLHDKDVKNGLLKIEYIDAFELNTSQCDKLLKLLPNLKSLGKYQQLSVLLPIVDDDNEIAKKLSNLTEFNDEFTSFKSVESFSKFCPNAKKISLSYPETKVIENLRKFPLLTELALDVESVDSVSELIRLLNQIGNQIKYLNLQTPGLEEYEFSPYIFEKICPELIKLEINDETFYFY